MGAPRPRFRPDVVQVELTTDCNYACPFCNLVTALHERPRARMDPEAYRAVAARDFAPPYTVILSGFGETFLHPRWGELVAFEKRRGCRVMVATNGAPLDARHRAELLRLRVDDVTVSLDTTDPDVYRQTRVGGELDRVRDNVTALQAEIRAARARTTIALNAVVTRRTRDGLADLVVWMGAAGLGQLYLIRMMPPGGRSLLPDGAAPTGADAVPLAEYAALDFDGLRQLGREHGVNVFWSDPDPEAHRACRLPSQGIYLSAAFDVSTCPFAFFEPGHAFGNLLERPLAELQAAAPWKHFREESRAGRFPAFCRDACACYFTQTTSRTAR